MSTPNFKPGVGRLVTDRFDFQNHTDGYNFNHKANQIVLSPTISISGTQTNVQGALTAIVASLAAPSVPDASTSVKGVIQLAGDLAGTATSVSVVKLNGKPIVSTIPNTNELLIWTGSTWEPKPLSFLPTLTASIVTYAGGVNWADGTTNPSTTVENQLDKILNDLSIATGDVKIGSPLRSGSPTSLAAGTLGSQVVTLLTALNAFQTQKAAAGGLASLDGSTKVPIAQLPTGVANGLATLDGYTKVTPAQLNLGVANGIATLDATTKVTPAQLNTAVANGLATLDGYTQLTSTQRAGWFFKDSIVTNNTKYGAISTSSSTAFVDAGTLTVSLTGCLIGDIVDISAKFTIGTADASGAEAKLVVNQNGGGFGDIQGSLIEVFGVNPFFFSTGGRFACTIAGTIIVKLQYRSEVSGSTSVTGPAQLYARVFRP